MSDETGGDPTFLSVRRVRDDEWWIRFDGEAVTELVAAAVRGLRPRQERSRPANAFRRWSTEDDVRLKERFSAGVPVRELARTFDRHEGAIKARLVTLGLLPEAEAPRMRR